MEIMDVIHYRSRVNNGRPGCRTNWYQTYIPCWVLGLLMICTPHAMAQEPPTAQSNEATNVFILRQLIEIQNELRDLRKEVAGLRQSVNEAKPTFRLPPPDSPLPLVGEQVALKNDDPSLGSREAKVAIVEFTDYQCPYCAKYHSQTFDMLKKEYIDTGKVQYFLRDFPLDFHDHAKGAAIAANCAGEQDAYWQMMDRLFANQSELGDELYQQSAQSLDLNMEQFEACRNSPDQAITIEEDMASGQEIGVDGTPAFFIGRVQNGQLVDAKKVSGAQPLTVFSRIIEPLLGKVGMKRE